jgi:type IV secretion system protein VirB9
MMMKNSAYSVMKKILTHIILLIVVSNSITLTVNAKELPRSMAVDHRIKTAIYDPDNVTVINAHYGYETQILFGEGESVQNVSIGDSLAWQAIPVTNHLFLKPIAKSVTDMTVLTNLHGYNFQLNSSNSKDPNAQIYELRFIYPDNENTMESQNGNPPLISQCPYYNGEYSYNGDKKLVPIQVFDDGKFTYFKFKSNGNAITPAIFSVDKDRNESLVNYHVSNGFIIVNRVGTQFTLRNGNYVTSVFNDKAIGDWKSVR